MTGLPDAAVITALFAGVVGLIATATGAALQFQKLRNQHRLAVAKARSDQYLIDYEELEDLRWWRRLAISALNKFLDDYVTRRIDPPVNITQELDYPPMRPASKAARRKRLDGD